MILTRTRAILAIELSKAEFVFAFCSNLKRDDCYYSLYGEKSEKLTAKAREKVKVCDANVPGGCPQTCEIWRLANENQNKQ